MALTVTSCEPCRSVRRLLINRSSFWHRHKGRNRVSFLFRAVLFAGGGVWVRAHPHPVHSETSYLSNSGFFTATFRYLCNAESGQGVSQVDTAREASVHGGARQEGGQSGCCGQLGGLVGGDGWEACTVSLLLTSFCSPTRHDLGFKLTL